MASIIGRFCRWPAISWRTGIAGAVGHSLVVAYPPARELPMARLPLGNWLQSFLLGCFVIALSVAGLVGLSRGAPSVRTSSIDWKNGNPAPAFIGMLVLGVAVAYSGLRTRLRAPQREDSDRTA